MKLKYELTLSKHTHKNMSCSSTVS